MPDSSIDKSFKQKYQQRNFRIKCYYRKCHPTTPEYMFYSAACRTFSKTYILKHKTNVKNTRKLK
jgi:hypothetical protein